MKRTQDCSVYRTTHAPHKILHDYVEKCPCCMQEKIYIQEYLVKGDIDGSLMEEYMGCQLVPCVERGEIEFRLRKEAERLAKEAAKADKAKKATKAPVA